MGQTPDDIKGGKTNADLVTIDDTASDPTAAGQITYNAGSFKAQDSIGVFNLRQGGGGGTLQDAYDNQGATPVNLGTNAVLDLEGAGLIWSVRDDTEADLFRIIEGSAGGTSEVEIGSAVDVLDVNAVLVQIDASGVSNFTVAGANLTVNTTTSGTLALTGATALRLDDGNRTGSTWAGAGIQLAASSAEWDAFEAAFGEVSLLNAIEQASGGGGGSSPYDFSGEVAGTPTVSSEVFHFKAARAFTLAASGHVAGCSAGPSASIQFDLQLNGVSIGDITFSGGTSGTVTIDSATTTAIVVNDIIKIVAPANLQGIDTPFWTFLGNT